MEPSQILKSNLIMIGRISFFFFNEKCCFTKIRFVSEEMEGNDIQVHDNPKKSTHHNLLIVLNSWVIPWKEYDWSGDYINLYSWPPDDVQSVLNSMKIYWLLSIYKHSQYKNAIFELGVVWWIADDAHCIWKTLANFF